MEVVNPQRVSGFFLSMFPNFPIFSGNIWGTFWEHLGNMMGTFSGVFEPDLVGFLLILDEF